MEDIQYKYYSSQGKGWPMAVQGIERPTQSDIWMLCSVL